MKVILYSEPGLQGNTQELKLGTYKVSELKISQLGSLQLPHWLRVIFYKDEAYGVQMAVFNGDSQSIAGRVDGAQALVVEPLPNFDFALVARHSQKILQVEDGSTADGAYVVQHGFTGGQHQRIRLAAIVDDPEFFKIIFPHSNKVLGTGSPVKEGSLNRTLQQQVWEKKDSQKWSISRGKDCYLLLNKQNRKAISVPNQRKDDNLVVETYQVIRQRGQTGHLHQQFSVERVINDKFASSYLPKGNEEYSIYTRHNKAIGIADNATTEAAAVIQQAPRANIYSQRFQFANARPDRYKIRNTHSDKFIGVASDRTGNGAPITQEEWQGRALQEWRLALQEDGYFRFLLGGTASNMDLANGSSADGAKLQQWAINGNLGNQSFRLELLPTVVNLKITALSALRTTEEVDLTHPIVTAGSERGTYTYFSDEKLTQIIPDPAKVAPGEYWIQLTTSDNRTIAKRVTVPIRSRPNLVLHDPAPVCAENTTDLTAAAITAGSDNGTLAYFLDEGLTQSVPNPTAVDAGDYYIKLTIGGDRFTSGKVTVTEHPMPILVVHNPEPVCWDQTVNLAQTVVSAVQTTEELGYFTDETCTQTVANPQAVAAGTYYIQLTTPDGCTVARAVTATLLPKPKLIIHPPQPACGELTLDLTATALTQGSDPGTISYYLDEGLTQAVETPDAVGTGTYYLQLQTEQGCAVSAPVTFVPRPIPLLVLLSPTPVCPGSTSPLLQAVDLQRSDPGSLSYTVNSIGATSRQEGSKLDLADGIPSPTFSVLHAETRVGVGTYTLQLTNEFGCSTTASVEITAYPAPRLQVAEEAWAYIPEKVDLTLPEVTTGSTPGTFTYFRDQALRQPLTLEEAQAVGDGAYYIQLTSPYGCTAEVKTINAVTKPRPSIAVPIHVDARFIAEKETCASPRLDFSKLPYYDGEKDINPYTPYLGEELEAVPFKNGEFDLEKGIHLHWALPDFLTKSFRYPMLDLAALRRATRVDRLGASVGDTLYTQLLTTFAAEEWIKPIPENHAYASILAEREQVDIRISELLTDAAPEQRVLGQEVLRVRSLLEPGGTQMPPVPNRWRVIRTGGGETQDWTVESDFLRPADQGDAQTGVSYPRPDPKPEEAPFGWLGRKYPTGSNPPAEAGIHLSAPLSTLGYGDPTFAAFYPNCHSVFGLHDDTAEAGKTYTYEIYGYYATENRAYEYFELQGKDLANRTEKAQLRQALSGFLRDYLKLPMTDETPGVWPDRLACCGKIVVNAEATNATKSPDITVTVGSTSTEAVSAYLANKISENKKIEAEEYLESLQYLRRLEHLKTDIGPKLREERHRQSFTSEKGGYRWVLVARNTTAGETERPVVQTTLTDNKAHFLHELNELQLAFDRIDEQIKSLRRQIFADWSKYMLCQYPPDGADDDYPDADQARFFIEHELMPWLNELNAERQQLAKGLRNHVQSFWHFRVGDIQSAAGLYAAMLNHPELRSWMDAKTVGSEAALVRCLNRYIDNKGYHDAVLTGSTGAPALSMEDILERQAYQNHLINNRRELETTFPHYLPQHPNTILKRKPHRPFHRPTDPVVLVTGDTLKTTRKHGQDGRLPHKLEVVQHNDLIGTARAIADQLIPADWKTSPGRHPLLLDWLVEFFPVEDTDFNLDAYEPDYLIDKYTLDLNAADLRATKDDLYAGVGQAFWGSALLANSGSKSLKQSLETFLTGELKVTDEDLKEIGTKRAHFFANDPWIKQYPSQPVTPDTFDAFYGWTPEGILPESLKELWAAKHKALALLAYEHLRETHFLAQALGGFTPALLQMREGYQLKIADPLGYPEYQEFSRKVNGAVGLLNHASALPNNPFFPIRAGAASLLELRLLDTFGQEIVHLKDIQEVIAAETLRPQHSHHHFELTPRLSQSARLNFHWLSATDDQVAHNEHPASSPICGWVLLNQLDKSLMIYDQQGIALGYIDREGAWRSTPGQRPGVLAEGIPNWHLRRMVRWLMSKAQQGADPADGQSDTIPHFMTLVQDALRHVEPPRGDHAGEGVAMLMSRPLALVRATASIELKGLPAVNQSWAQFREVIESPAGDRESTLNMEGVALPLRIGEDHQLNDGLVGFWQDAEDGEAYRDDSFRLPSLHRAIDGNREHTDEHVLDVLTVGTGGSRGKSIIFNLLIDPHGSVHATCGILPVQELTLPKDIYYDALEKMEVSFLTSPLITPQEMIHLSLPEEPGFQWSWVEIDRRQWRELSTIGHFRKQELLAVFGGAGEILWDQLIERGWIVLDRDQAAIVPAGRRPATENFPPDHLAPQLEHFLASRQIHPFQLSPAGRTGQEIREGWLKLRPMPALPSNPEENQA